MRRRLAIGVAVAALASAIVATVRWRGRDAPIGPTATVERGTIERIVVASGTIEPEHLVEVRSKVSGIIQRLHVDAGDRVVAGQDAVCESIKGGRSFGAYKLGVHVPSSYQHVPGPSRGRLKTQGRQTTE